MARGRGAGDMANRLRHGNAVRQGGKGNRRVVALLHLQPGPVDGPPVQPRRGAGLQPPQPEAESLQRRRQPIGGRVAYAPGRNRLFAHMDKAAQEGPGRQHHARRGELLALGRDNAGDAAFVVQPKVLDRRRADFQVLLLRQHGLHRRTVQRAVGLGTRAPDGGPLAAVQDAELDSGPVDHPRHDAVQRIDLTHQMALAQAADGRIAGHLADRLEPVRCQQRTCADARGRGRRLAARMPATDDDDVPTILVRCLHRATR